MPEKDAFEERRRAHEEEYFRNKERELIEKLRRRAEASSERQDMGESLGVEDDEVLASLQALGFTRDTVMLLHLVPLVQLGWASGSVTARERAAIVEAARSRGVAEGSPADTQLAEWLARRPSSEFFSEAIRAIRAILASLPEDEHKASAADIVSCCRRVARISGGVLGLGRKICDGEQAVLARLAADLARDHAEEAGAIKDGLT
jgi:hypothetical protein